jgi:integrase
LREEVNEAPDDEQDAEQDRNQQDRCRKPLVLVAIQRPLAPSRTSKPCQRVEGTTKSGRSRTVSLDPGTVQVLRDRRKRQDGERLKVGPEWCGTDDYVFSTAWGKPIHPDTVSSLMTALIVTHNDRQGEPLPHARLHDLRHVHATTLLLAGVPVHVVAARLGHADPSITLRVYAHAISDQLAEAADIFARAVAATS